MDDWEVVYRDWALQAVFPLWSRVGLDEKTGIFHEALNLDGSPAPLARRARVQGRQSFSWSMAGRLGWQGPWEAHARAGLTALNTYYRREDGLLRTLVAADGSILDDSAMVYDQCFAMLAAAALHETHPSQIDMANFALDLLAKLAVRRHPAGGFREDSDPAFLSNPHMHLFEAALAWIEAGGGSIWQDLADEVATLCLRNFFDPDKRVLREYFDGDWRALETAAPGGVEPGHQFEWAWLLERWARLRGREDAHQAAQAMFASGVRGVDSVRNVAIDETNENLIPHRSTARLWPQTERLKAALLFADGAEGQTLQIYEAEAEAAARSLWGYLQTSLPGLWRDKMLIDGSYVDEPAPASSLYHIICAVACLRDHRSRS